MRNYTTEVRELGGRPIHTQPMDHDLYKADRAEIEAMRERFARELRLDRAREMIR